MILAQMLHKVIPQKKAVAAFPCATVIGTVIHYPRHEVYRIVMLSETFRAAEGALTARHKADVPVVRSGKNVK
jgi:hypothetical protein